MEILADTICIIDTNGIIRYFKVFRDEIAPEFQVNNMIGRHFMSVFKGISKEGSTFLNALKGITTLNNIVTEQTFNGKSSLLMESVYPIELNGEIIGAACISRAANSGSFMAFQKIVLKSVDKKRENPTILSNLIGISPSIKNLKLQIMQSANSKANVLIYGETGTGKEMVAEAIHSVSQRQNKTFYAQNCAAIPSSLLESIFFGTEKGIYTGATDRAGILELSDGGTIFLDEINSLDISMQAKLLKALEEKQVRRLGSKKIINTDFRVVAATNENPFDCISSGKMRSDLFYRLSSIILEIPPLRERMEDIPILANHFIELCNKENEHQIIGLADETLDIFQSYSWPGNVREFKNAIESASIFASTPFIKPEDIPHYIISSVFENNISSTANQLKYVAENAAEESISGFDTSVTLQDACDSFEKAFLKQCLSECSNHTQLAKRLNISRQTLLNKLHKHLLI